MTSRRQSEERPTQLKILRRALSLQLTLQEIVRALGETEGQRCMNIGDEAGVFGYHLRGRGGEWSTVVSDEKQGALTREVVGDEVHVIADARLPFEDKTFDAIVVINFLETTRADEKFIEECHRVLKREGRLVVNAGNLKTWTIIQPLRRLLGVSYDRRGLARAGYSEPEMFRILKHGFDVSNMRTYRRFCVTLVDTIMAAAVGPCETVADLDKAVQRYSFAVPFYRLAFQIDMLLFVARGFSLICAAKRRAWLPRKTPVLSDGRSISEAVLSRAFE